jgi:hypothetical protein
MKIGKFSSKLVKNMPFVLLIFMFVSVLFLCGCADEPPPNETPPPGIVDGGTPQDESFPSVIIDNRTPMERYIDGVNSRSAMQSGGDDGLLTLAVSSRGTLIIYTYTYSENAFPDDLNDDDIRVIASALSEAVESSTETFEIILAGIRGADGLADCGLSIEYYAPDGRLIYAKEFTVETT